MDITSVATALGLVAGQHAGEFELALYSYYGGTLPIIEPADFSLPKFARPEKIFGLDIQQRSSAGVIAAQKPDYDRAQRLSDELGVGVDKGLRDLVVNNLDIYFEHWSDASNE